MLACLLTTSTPKAKFQAASRIGWLPATVLSGALLQAAPVQAGPGPIASTPGTDPTAAIASFTNLTPNATVGATNTYGYEFTTAGPIAIKSLGVFDYLSDGLNTAHDVGIWDSSGTLKAFVNVPTGTTASLINGFRYQNLNSIVNLQAGTYRIGALYTPSSDNFAQKITSSGAATAGLGITLGDPFISSPNPVLTQPTNASPLAAPGYFGPNFQYDSVPGPLPLFGAATAFGFSRRLRRRIRRGPSVGA